MALIEVKDLGVQFKTGDGLVYAVNGINFSLDRGQTLGIVGESGSGKSQSVLAMMGLLAQNGKASGQALYDGQDLLTMKVKALNRIRGNRVAMIFQDPMTSLNPYLTVERQMTEVLQFHKGMDRTAARARSVALLDAVKIPDAARRIRMYPHEFSGGMRQRVMIAMALVCRPSVLIADEPTTALDVTIQSQILRLIDGLRAELGTAVLMITHNLAVVAGIADEIVVMYAGRVVERGSREQLFDNPLHPYTLALFAAMPRTEDRGRRLAAIGGQVPSFAAMPPGCRFAPRCPFALERCHRETPPLMAHEVGHDAACWRAPLEDHLS